MPPEPACRPRPRVAARLTLACLILIAVAGGFLSLSRGRLPQRDVQAQPPQADQPALSPDLALYRDMIAQVRARRGYYAAGRELIPHYGFPIASPLNWRLPTSAWLFARLPGPLWIQALLIGLSLLGLVLAFLAEARSSNAPAATVLTLFLAGALAWAFDGQACLAQEPWAATLILISLSAYRFAGCERERPDSHHKTIRVTSWTCLAIGSGLAALAFRELALPYCAVALGWALHRRRWVESMAWILGIGGFTVFYCWHVLQIREQIAGTAADGSLSQWLRFGGLDFVLLTLRMNKLLFAAPAWALWWYLVAALMGLASRRDDAGRMACLTTLAFLLAFAILGRPENFYWGLMIAPLLPWGIVPAISTFHRLARPILSAEPTPAPGAASIGILKA